MTSASRGPACRLLPVIAALIITTGDDGGMASTLRGVLQPTRQPEMVQSIPAGPASIPPQAAGVTLSCRPDRAGNRLIFPYIVENHGIADIYVMDAVVVPERTSGRPVLDRNAPVIWLGGDGFARVLQGIAALPPDRDVDVRVIPLAARLPPGESLERRLEVPLPLAEVSPYYPDLPLREYELTDIQGVSTRSGIPAWHGRGFRR